MTSAPPLADAFRFFNEIGIIEQLSRTAFERVLPEGLSFAGFGVLNHFVRLNKDGEQPVRLARAFQVTKGAMTNTVQRLEALGYVTVEADPADGRGKIVRITPAGRAAREEAIARLGPLLEAVQAACGAETLTACLPHLERVRRFLDDARTPVDQ